MVEEPQKNQLKQGDRYQPVLLPKGLAEGGGQQEKKGQQGRNPALRRNQGKNIVRRLNE